MSSKVLIAATTSAVTSTPFSAANNNNIAIVCSGLGAGETLTLQVYNSALNGGPGWTNVVVNGSNYQCDSNNNLILWDADVLTYRVVKTSTASPVGVSITANILLGV